MQSQLQLSDYKEIELEIELCNKRLKEIPTEKIKTARKSESEKLNAETKINDLLNRHVDLEKLMKLKDIYEQSFIQEYTLGYCYTQVDNIDSLKLAYKMIKGIDEDKNIKSKGDLENSIFAKYYENSQFLREYIAKNRIFI